MHSREVRNRHIVNLYTSGLNCGQIAERLSLGVSTVRKILVDAGVKRRARGCPYRRRLDHDAIVKAFINGKTRIEIADEWGTNRGVINRILRQHGWHGHWGVVYRAPVQLEAAE